MSTHEEIENAYGSWAEDLVREGWTPYLLTFMFRPIGGSPSNVAREMEREVERVFTTMLTRIVRHPNRPASVGRLPIWFCALDRPVFKHAKQSLSDVVVNDGYHVHAAAFLPPWSRLPESLDKHVTAQSHLYLRPETTLIRIDVVRITCRVGYVVYYVRKLTGRSIIGEDADFILPRALCEVRNRAA